MNGFLRWFKTSAKVKRWIFLGIIGIALLCFGISKILISKTLATNEIIQVVISFVLGIASIIISMIYMQKRMLEILVEESDTRKEKNNVCSLIFNKKIYNQGPKIVVIGGGSGLNTVLKGLKNYTDNITAIVTISDYGETPTDSKKALQVLPLDDIKESLVALSYDENAMESLLNCKFSDGKLNNLSFGDIYFLAMNKIYGNFKSSIENAKNILNITGNVIPVTLDPINICAELEDGTIVEDRSKIPEVVSETTSKISRIYITPTNSRPAPGVIEAIEEADAIVIGPGSLYTNVIPNLLIKGIARAIKESKAIKVYVSNIMTEMGQTDEYTLSDHIKAINDYVGEGIIDYCIYDTGEIVPEFIHKYNLKGADVVLPDTQKAKDLGVKLIQRNLSKIDGDSIRHDSDVIASTLIQLICDELVFQDMQNNSQYMMLNSKLKESKREIRKREKAEKKFQKSGKKPFEKRNSGSKSKFTLKYQDRIQSIKESTEKAEIAKQKVAERVEKIKQQKAEKEEKAEKMRQKNEAKMAKNKQQNAENVQKQSKAKRMK